MAAAREEGASEQPASELPVVDSVSDYEKLHHIGEGTYGVVCEQAAAQEVPNGPRSRSKCLILVVDGRRQGS